MFSRRQIFQSLCFLSSSRILEFQNNDTLFIYSFYSEETLVDRFHFNHIGYIRQAKLDDSKKYLGLLTSPNRLTIYILNYSSKTVEWKTDYVTDSKLSSETILGFEWISSNEFICICSSKVIRYTLMDGKIQEIDKIPKPIQCYVFENKSITLLLSHGQGHLSVLKLKPEIHIHAISIDSTKMLYPWQLTLLYVNERTLVSVHSSAQQQECILLLEQGKEIQQLLLPQPGKTFLLAHDNCILVLNFEAQNAYLYDLKVTHGMQLSPMHVFKMDIELSEFPMSNGTNLFLFPVANVGLLLDMHFEYLFDSMMQTLPFLDTFKFLASRTYEGIEKHLETFMLKSFIEKKASLEEYRQMFNVLHELQKRKNLEGLRLSRLSLNKRRMSVIEEPLIIFVPVESPMINVNMMDHVLLPLVNDPNLDALAVYHILFTYLTSALNYNISVDEVIFESLVRLLMKTQQWMELETMLMTRLLPDTPDIARWVFESRQWCPSFHSLAVAMFMRLNHHQKVIECYLESGMIQEGFNYAIQKKQLHNPQLFLELAYTSKNETMFFTVFRYYQNWLQSGSPNSPMLDFEKYVSLYREIWDPVVEMENMS